MIPLTAAPASRADHAIAERNAQSYIAEYGAPVIAVPDVLQFRHDKDSNLHNKIKARLGDLQREYKELEDLYEFNVFTDQFEHAYVPVAGHTYYMYNNAGHKFLSLIHPADFTCKYEYCGAARYNGQGFFEKAEVQSK